MNCLVCSSSCTLVAASRSGRLQTTSTGTTSSAGFDPGAYGMGAMVSAACRVLVPVGVCEPAALSLPVFSHSHSLNADVRDANRDARMPWLP